MPRIPITRAELDELRRRYPNGPPQGFDPVQAILGLRRERVEANQSAAREAERPSTLGDIGRGVLHGVARGGQATIESLAQLAAASPGVVGTLPYLPAEGLAAVERNREAIDAAVAPQTTPGRVASGLARAGYTMAEYGATGGMARAAGLVPKATGLAGRITTGALASAPMDVLQGLNPETSSAQFAADLGVPGARRVALSPAGRIASELVVGNVLGAPLETVGHFRGLRRARTALAAENEAKRVATVELQARRQELGQFLDALQGRRTAPIQEPHPRPEGELPPPVQPAEDIARMQSAYDAGLQEPHPLSFEQPGPAAQSNAARVAVEARGARDAYRIGKYRKAGGRYGLDAEAPSAPVEAPRAATADVGYEAVGGKARHDAMNGFSRAVREVAASGEDVAQAIQRFPDVQMLEAERPGRFAEWVGLWRGAKAKGQPIGAIEPALMRSLASTGVGAAGGGVVGAELNPENRVEGAATGALVGGLLGLGVSGATAGRVRPRNAGRVVPSELTPRQVQRYMPRNPAADVNLTEYLTPRRGPKGEAIESVWKFGLEDTPENLSLFRRSVGQARQALLERGIDFKKPVTHAQMLEHATVLSLDPAAIARRPATRLTGEEALGLRIATNAKSEEIAQLSRQLADPETAMSDVDRAFAERWTAKLLEEHRALVGQFTQTHTGFGRNLNSLKVIGRQQLDPATWHSIAERMKGIPLDDMESAALSRALASKDREAVLRTVAGLATPSRVQKAVTLLKAAWLFRLTTHARNLLSNAGNVAFREVANIPSTALDALVSTVTGQRTKGFRGAGAAWRRGQAEGVAEAKRLFHGGISTEALQKMDVHRNVNFDTPIIQKAVGLVFNSLGAEDALFSRGAYQRALAEDAYSIAMSAGLKGEALDAEAIRLLRAPTPSMQLAATDAAAEATFRQSTVLQRGVESAKKAMRGHPIAELASEVTLPFVRTPLAVGETAIRYSPLGFIQSANRGMVLRRLMKTVEGPAGVAELRRAQRRFVEATGQALTGTTLGVMLGYHLYNRGKMTGPLPATASARDQWNLERKKPFSVLVGNRWYGLPGVAPLGTLLSVGAALAEADQNLQADLPGKASHALSAAGAAFMEQPALTGVMRTLEAVSDVAGAGTRYAQNQVSGAVPGLVGQVARGMDPYVRQPRGMLQALATRIPGLSRTVPARINAFGEPIEREGNMVTNLVQSTVDPFASSPARSRTDPLLGDLERLGVQVPGVRPRPNETPEEFQHRQQTIGRLTKMTLVRARMSAPFQSLDPEGQAEFLRRAINAAHQGNRFDPTEALRAIVRGPARERKSMIQRRRALQRAEILAGEAQ